ncbi:MAG: glycosyltransferase [Bacteroidetes bacterium]|nr:glycosyltransferase [Bacteroidota bacterium]
MEKVKIIFLYTELATYFLACIEKLLEYPNSEIHIVHWPVNKEAPFNFSFSDNVKIYNRNDYSAKQLEKLVSAIDPSVIYSSGWIDKGYLQICKQYKNKIPVIVGFDTQWKGSIKQHLLTLISPFKILNRFTHCWVPGELQHQYALHLGFKKSTILTGFYTCDFNFFYNQYLFNKETKQKKFPKRFIYVGRYLEFKGIKDLWQAFIELQNEKPNEWELWCLGAGDIAPILHPKIKHFGFVQPNDLQKYIKETGVFVLPSRFEPWGVVIHEFAAAGFPIVCSDEVGARVTFVEQNVNGYVYKAGNIIELKKQFKKIMDLSSNELFEMGEKSVDKAQQLTPSIWSEKLMQIVTK